MRFGIWVCTYYIQYCTIEQRTPRSEETYKTPMATIATAPTLSRDNFGAPHTLPTLASLNSRGSNRPSAVRQRVLLETLGRIERDGPRYRSLAQANVRRWCAERREKINTTPAPAKKGSVCEVRVLPGDWGQVTLELTREYGTCFAALNMANAYCPGGGYAQGMVAQEENMFRRTDCHFSLDRSDLDERGMYLPQKTNLLNGVQGRVYIDADRPRVCIRGPEDRRDPATLGYAWLEDGEVFPFLELRAAAQDLRMSRRHETFDWKLWEVEAARRIAAQLDTLVEKGVRFAVLSAFGCGAFKNPADRVAVIYREQLQLRASDFDVVAFAIFHAGYGPNNFIPFAEAFEGWGEAEGEEVEDASRKRNVHPVEEEGGEVGGERKR